MLLTRWFGESKMKPTIYRHIKALYVCDKYFIGAKGYRLYKYDFTTKRYEYIGRVKDFKYALLSNFKLTRRFFRAEINNLYNLPNGDSLIIAKKGIFKCKKGCDIFVKCFNVPRGSRPLNLCITPNGTIYFGEYFANTSKESVNIYASNDGGDNWSTVYTFPNGSINHIHGIFYDIYTERIWIATGDRENECIIGYTEDGFQSIVKVFRGGQEYRTCNLYFYPDFITFATDSQYITNEIKCFNRNTLSVESLMSISGTAIKGGQCGELSFLSTTVEPSEVNHDTYSHLWASCNGKEWRDIYSAEKDSLPSIMQFGSIEFPYHNTDKFVMCSGRALKKIDGTSLKISL